MRCHPALVRRIGGAAFAALAIAALLTTPAEAARPRPAPSCGSTVLKAGGSPWICTFVDNFDGYKLDTSKWAVQETYTSGYQNGGECFVNSPNNVSVADGVLSLTARREASGFLCQYPGGSYSTQYTSGMVSTYGRFSQAYGRFEIRAKFPAAQVAGLQSALWLWPNDPYKYGAWPGSGEIDIAEAYSQYPDRVIPYIHYNTSLTDSSVTNNYCMISDVSAFHSYVAEWTPTQITIMYDGQTCLAHELNPSAPLTGSQPFDQPFIVALTQALGQGSNAVTASTPLPATTQVDYVRVWK
jgi:beta-glucanase (GH16 family)